MARPVRARVHPPPAVSARAERSEAGRAGSNVPLDPLQALRQSLGNQAIQRLAPAVGAERLVALQHAVGNQAIQRLLDRSATTDDRGAEAVESAASDSGTATIQRKKTPEERAEKHRRIAKSSDAITTLDGKLDAGFRGHLFDAKPVSGGAPDPKSPTGLHAYRGGGLPGFVQVTATQGSVGQVHGITWQDRNWKPAKPTDTAPTKASTMFPSWMPESHVAALIALKYPGDTKILSEKVDLLTLGVGPEEIQTHILHGQSIKLTKKGETVYPEK